MQRASRRHLRSRTGIGFQICHLHMSGGLRTISVRLTRSCVGAVHDRLVVARAACAAVDDLNEVANLLLLEEEDMRRSVDCSTGAFTRAKGDLLCISIAVKARFPISAPKRTATNRTGERCSSRNAAAFVVGRTVFSAAASDGCAVAYG